MPAGHHYTASDLAAMPDDRNRYEIVHGELFVTPTPPVRHQAILVRLVLELSRYLEPHRLDDELVMSPLEVTFAFDTVVQPDLFVADTAAALQSDQSTDIRTLYVAIEIISPPSARADRVIKRRLYQEKGIPEYWVIDEEQQHVEVWIPGAATPAIERDVIRWRHPALDVSCEIDLVRLFDFG